MCAITGIIRKTGIPEVKQLKEMAKEMILRGPDKQDFFVDNNVGLAHQRLSIIDLTTGSQPMTIDNGNITIVYNGEVYNYLEIKEELTKKGVDFQTTSDTEVVVYAYKVWGLDRCLELIDGMFAFAIYDKTKQVTYIVRDRYGEKPLYYYVESENFYFASELKAFSLHKQKFSIDKTALNLFLSLSYIPAPYSIYNEIKKVLPGHYLSISNDMKIEDHLYYNVSTEIKESITNKEEGIQKVQELLTDSIKKRMVADVPMGAFLSGGIDSSIVCCLMSKLSEKPINTFSIGFKEKDYDESERAELIVKHIKSNHTKYILDYKDVIDCLDDIILYYDEPFGDSSAIPSYYVAKLAAKDVKVVLTGDCADELFGGYEKYLAEYYVTRYRKVPKLVRKLFEWFVCHCPESATTRSHLRRIKKVIRNAQKNGFDLYYNMMCLGFNEDMRKQLLATDFYTDIKHIFQERYKKIPNDFSFLQKEQIMDIQGVLEGDMFPKMDRACMHNSIENRAPFLDRRIVHTALNLADNLKIRRKNKKYILKEAFKNILPSQTLQFRKSGFGVPVDYWFRNELKSEMEKLMEREFIEKQGIFNYQFLIELFNEHIQGKENHKGQLWNFYVFQRWYLKNYLKNERPSE